MDQTKFNAQLIQTIHPSKASQKEKKHLNFLWGGRKVGNFHTTYYYPMSAPQVSIAFDSSGWM